MVEHLCKTDHIVLTELQGKLLIFSPDRYEEHKKKRDAIETTPPVVSPSDSSSAPQQP
jgi:hypothetical protein